MQKIPLFGDEPSHVIQTTTPLDCDSKCAKCELHTRVRRTRCVPGEGDPGGLLVVGGPAGQKEDSTGLPFSSNFGIDLRGLLERWWNGPIALDHAVKCYPGGVEQGADERVKAEHADECRPYLAQTIRDAKPKRILALGRWAIYSVLGRALQPSSVHRGVSWLWRHEATGNVEVPVFLLFDVNYAFRNRFAKKDFESALRWALTCEPPWRPPWGKHALVVSTREDAEEAARRLRAAPWLAFDTETMGRMFDTNFRVLSAACTPAGTDETWVWDRQALCNPDVVEPLKELLEDPRVKKVGQNIKYDLLAVRLGLGVRVEGTHMDVRLVRKLLQADAAFDLETMGELVGMGGHKQEAQDAIKLGVRTTRKSLGHDADLTGTAAEGDELLRTLIWLGEDPRYYSYALMPRDVLLRYNARDSITTARLGTMLEPMLQKSKAAQRIWEMLIKPASRAVEQVEWWGAPVDVDRLEAFKSSLEVEIEQQGKALKKWGDFNPNSVPQLRELLYTKLKLPVPKTVKPKVRGQKGPPSTDKEALEALADKYEIARVLLRWRYITKMHGTYAVGLSEHVTHDRRIHPTYLLDGARSGRLSCKEPNLQNIPRADDEEKPEGKTARDLFCAPKGKRLLQFDYSQLELRVAAYLSGDEVMRKMFESGEDFHLATAKMLSQIIWGIKPEEVQKKHRSVVKAFNFGTLYGMTPQTMAGRLEVEVEEAERIQRAIFGRFRKLASWIAQQLSDAQKTGETWTYWEGEKARRRPLWSILDETSKQKSVEEHSAHNTTIQGTASDYCLASLVECVKWIEENAVPAKLVITVHDSLVFEVEEAAVSEVLSEVPRIMSQWDAGGVALVIDAEEGESWGSLSKIEK